MRRGLTAKGRRLSAPHFSVCWRGPWSAMCVWISAFGCPRRTAGPLSGALPVRSGFVTREPSELLSALNRGFDPLAPSPRATTLCRDHDRSIRAGRDVFFTTCRWRERDELMDRAFPGSISGGRLDRAMIKRKLNDAFCCKAGSSSSFHPGARSFHRSTDLPAWRVRGYYTRTRQTQSAVNGG